MPLVHVAPPPGLFRNGTRYQSAGRWYDGNLVRWHEGAMRPVGGWKRFAEGATEKENLLLRSYRIDQSPWAGTATFASRSSFFGLSARAVIGGAGAARTQPVGALPLTPHTFSAVVEQDGALDTVSLELHDLTAPGSIARVDYVFSTGVATLVGGGSGSDSSVGALVIGEGPNAGTLVRLWVTTTPPASNNTEVRLHVNDGQVTVHQTQLSEATEPQGWVFTTDAALDGVPAGRIELGEAAQGMLAWRDNSGLARLALGTRCRVHVYVDGSLSEITPAGFECGLTLAENESGQYGAGSYGAGLYGEGDGSSESLVEAQSWQFDTFGQFLVGMAISDGKIYQWQLDDETPMAVVANAPTDNLGLVVTPERFLVALGANGDGRTVAWADQQSLTDWTPSSTNQAGDFPLAGQGSLMAGLRGRGETLLWTDKALWSMQFVGGTLIYSFREIGSECGPISRRSPIVVGGGVALWMGRRNFFVYDGHVRALPSEVGDYVFSDLNRFQASQIHAVSLSEFNEVWWFYPSSGSQTVNRYVSFNYVENTWSFGTVDRTAGVDRGVFPRPLMVDRYGVVYDHEQGSEAPVDFLGNEIAVFADGGLMELGAGDQRMWAMNYIPDQNTLGSLEAKLVASGYPTEPQTTHGPFDAANPTSVRVSGRQVSLRVDQVQPGWRLGRPRLDVRPAEER